MKIIKSEWHQVEKRYGLEISKDDLSRIYPDLDDDNIATKYQELIDGEIEIEELIEDAQEMGIYLDWDWLDEDDWWTDRKGGYEVTYEYQSDDNTSDEDNDDEDGIEQVDQDEKVILYNPNGTGKKITISLYGLGTDYGVGKITKEQYDYWNENSDQLMDVLNCNFDYDENDTPEECRLPYEYYNDYTDVCCFSGPDSECRIEIVDENGYQYVDTDMNSFLESIGDKYCENLEETKEFYFEYNLEKGHYIYWAQGGKGTFFSTTLELKEGQHFDPMLLKFHTVDFQGNSLITEVLYNNKELNNDNCDWTPKWADYEVVEQE